MGLVLLYVARNVLVLDVIIPLKIIDSLKS